MCGIGDAHGPIPGAAMILMGSAVVHIQSVDLIQKRLLQTLP